MRSQIKATFTTRLCLIDMTIMINLTIIELRHVMVRGANGAFDDWDFG